MDTAPHTPPGQERADLIDTLGRSSLGVLSREALLDLATTSRPVMLSTFRKGGGLRAGQRHRNVCHPATRICVELENLALDRSLSEGVRRVPIGHEHALVTCDAILAEGDGRWGEGGRAVRRR